MVTRSRFPEEGASRGHVREGPWGGLGPGIRSPEFPAAPKANVMGGFPVTRRPLDAPVA